MKIAESNDLNIKIVEQRVGLKFLPSGSPTINPSYVKFNAKIPSDASFLAANQGAITKGGNNVGAKLNLKLRHI